MIVSGGVNIYPQETENLLIMHPKVVDAAVFGVPNEEFGEEVKAVVQPARRRDAGPELEEELIDYCRATSRIQVSALGGLRSRVAPGPQRQALQAAHPRPLLAGTGVTDCVTCCPSLPPVPTASRRT